MHKIIRMIVEANSEDDAMNKATTGFTELIEKGEGGHDYFVLFNTEMDGSMVAGTCRWGDQKSPMLLDSKEALESLKGGLAATRKDFDRSADIAREKLTTKTNEEILEAFESGADTFHIANMDLDDVANTDNFVYKYGTCGLESVYSNKILQRTLGELKGKTAYVVLADVHW